MSEPRYALIATVGTNDFRLPDSMLIELGKRQDTYLNRKLRRDDGYKEIQDTQDYRDYCVRLVGWVSQCERERSHARRWGKLFQEQIKVNPALSKELKPENFPIIKEVLFQEDESKGEILISLVTDIFLIATDQKGEDSRDTLHYAQIIKDFLPQIDGFDEGCNIEVLPFIKSSPVHYTDVKKEIEDCFAQIKSSRNFERVYLSPTAGTPAISMALISVGQKVFGDKALTLYIPDEYTGV